MSGINAMVCDHTHYYNANIISTLSNYQKRNISTSKITYSPKLSSNFMEIKAFLHIVSPSVRNRFSLILNVIIVLSILNAAL